jgi:transaldolase
MKPEGLKSKIFLDSGDPKQTSATLSLLGFLDGQTTNPSLIAKNPEAQSVVASGKKFTQTQALELYKKIIQEISSIIPEGSVSVEVYADAHTTAEDMLSQAREAYTWIPNAYIKLPINRQGILAAKQAVKEDMRLNMTLCFSQEQAAAVYAATLGAKPGQVYVSPFIGRLDDIGINGMGLIKNIVKMFESTDGHVLVLAASIRNLNHLECSLAYGADIVTAPLSIYEAWNQKGKVVPSTDYFYNSADLKNIDYRELDLSKDCQCFNINHSLTDQGIEKFVSDWNSIIAKN